MDKIGLDITDSFNIGINDIREVVLEGLKNSKIGYTIPFDKVNKDNVKETIITMRDPDIEITLENDIVQYIKTVNTEYSQLDTIKDLGESPAIHIQKIKKRIEEKFGLDSKDVKIEAIDSATMNVTVILSYGDNEKARMHVIRDAFGNIFINTITHMA